MCYKSYTDVKFTSLFFIIFEMPLQNQSHLKKPPSRRSNMQINWFVGEGMVLYTLVRRRVPVEGAICK